MAVADAQAFLNQGGGDPASGFVSAQDIKDALGVVYSDHRVALDSGVSITGGSASPNGTVTASPGSLYHQSGSSWVSWWRKDTGTGNTGWVILSAPDALTGVTPGNMSHWRAALSRVRNRSAAQSARVLFTGTSHVYGWGAEDVDGEEWAFPFAVAKNIDAMATTAVKFMEPTNNFSTVFTHKRSYMTRTGSWATNTVTGVADNGRIELAVGAGGTFTYTHPDCEYFVIMVRDWNNTFRVTVDGGTPATVTNTNTGVWLEVTVSAGARGAHSLVVDQVTGVDELAVGAVGGGLNSGILVSNYGVPGSTSLDWQKDGTSAWASMPASFLGHQPDLVVHMIGGGNEVTDGISAASFKTYTQTLISYVQSNTSADMILIPPVWTTTYDAYRTAVYELGASNDVPVFDAWRVLGGVPESWDNGSGHLLAAAHQIIARELAAAITGF